MSITDTNEIESIKTFYRHYEEAFLSRDLDRFVDCHDDEVVCLPPDGSPIYGIAAWRSWLSGWWDHVEIVEAPRYIEEILVDGEWAFEWHTEKMVMGSGDKQTVSYGKGLHVLRKQVNGGWKLARYIWNSSPEPKPSS